MGNRSRPRDFVGRNEELATISQAIDAARNGLPSVLLVGGDAGIGKSTLISVGAERADVLAYFGRCLYMGGDLIPLVPMVDLLRQIRRAFPDALTSTPGLASLAH